MVHYFENYCTECGWNANTTRHEAHTTVGKRAVEHHVDSGHRIESRSLTYPIPVA